MTDYRNISNEMTVSERLAAYKRGEEVDCIPYGFIGLGDLLAREWGFTKKDLGSSFKVRAEFIRRMEEEYRVDELATGIGLRTLGEAVGSTIVRPELSTDYIERHAFTDGVDLGLMEDFEVCGSTFFQEMLVEAERQKDAFPHMPMRVYLTGPMSTAVSMRPIEKVLRDTRRNPEALRAMLEFSVRVSLDYVAEVHRRTGCVSVDISDPVSTTDILGAKQFRVWSLPYFRQMFEGVQRIVGVKPMVHICGHTHGIWQDLKDLGVTDFSIDNCENMECARQELGDAMCLYGNIAPYDVMCAQAPDGVIREVRRLIDAMEDSPKGYVLMPGCSLAIDTPKVNVDAYVWAAHTYGGPARLGERRAG